MKRKFLFFVSGMLICTLFALGQNTENVIESRMQQGRAFKSIMPQQEKSDSYEVTGSKLISISVANTADGSQNSYKHAMRLVLGLSFSNPKAGPAQLVFYSGGESIPYAEITENGVLNIYYPYEVYETIRQRLEESLAARRKVQLKITEKPTGYREAVLVF
jgi:hypothetical protein